MISGPRFRIAVLCCFAVFFSSTAAFAQAVPQRRPLATDPAPAKAEQPATPMVSAGESELIEISLNKVKVISLDVPVGKIIVGNETIALPRTDPDDPTRIIIVSRAIGLTNFIFFDEKGAIIKQAEVRVFFDHGGIKAALAKLLPDETIEVTVFRDSVFLTGKVHSARAAENAVNIASRFVGDAANIVNMMTISGSQQVILKVRVTEMDRNVRKNLAVRGTFAKDLWIGKNTKRIDISSTATVTAFGAASLTTGTNIFGTLTFDVLEQQDLVKTLAEPTLTAISGQTASFLSGGEFPFAAGLDENGQTIFEFREFGISLNFTPVVLDNGRISLKIETEISSLGDTITVGSTGTFQSLVQKRTSTTVELPSGGSIMISGLLTDDITSNVTGFPYLKDIPILGALFRSETFLKQQSELVITVTAYLVNPVDRASDMAWPTDGFESPSDIDIYLLGRLQSLYGDEKKGFWEYVLEGPFGYIMK
ncbi:MAG: type II and III secretion system protein family protein [Proteobacteria bacterium]|nr:type II and III secretion system protein family protein [Pseudomonadota bacterium]